MKYNTLFNHRTLCSDGKDKFNNLQYHYSVMDTERVEKNLITLMMTNIYIYSYIYIYIYILILIQTSRYMMNSKKCTMLSIYILGGDYAIIQLIRYNTLHIYIYINHSWYDIPDVHLKLCQSCIIL